MKYDHFTISCLVDFFNGWSSIPRGRKLPVVLIWGSPTSVNIHDGRFAQILELLPLQGILLLAVDILAVHPIRDLLAHFLDLGLIRFADPGRNQGIVEYIFDLV